MADQPKAGHRRCQQQRCRHVILALDGRRSTVPMRYRILPATGFEVPDTYNAFNARRNSLTSVRSWKPLFGKKHCIFPFLKFYEWIVYPPTGKKTEIEFSPNGIPRMWAASLYEEYQSPTLGLIRSFAMVTDDPPEEIKATGHDRVPIFIDEDLIDDWLHPQGKRWNRSMHCLTISIGHISTIRLRRSANAPA